MAYNIQRLALHADIAVVASILNLHDKMEVKHGVFSFFRTRNSYHALQPRTVLGALLSNTQNQLYSR
jgi:hypothetical protein